MAVKPREVQLVVRVNQLELDINKLRTQYEQFFMGIIKIPPATLHRNIKKTVAEIEKRPITNSTLRFRYQQIRARLISYQTYWRRSLHQIEAGTFRRDRYRLKRREKENAEKATLRKSRRERKTATNKDTAAERIDGIYAEFIAGREKCGEPTKGISRDKLSAFIQKQESAIHKKYGKRDVDFKVVVENGKTKLRAVLKKNP